MLRVDFTEQGLLAGLARLTGQAVSEGRLTLTAPFGSGYLQQLVLRPGLQLLITDVTLHQAVRLHKTATPADQDAIVFSFRQLVGPDTAAPARQPAVQVSAAGGEMELVLPANLPLHTLLITLHTSLLHEWLHHPAEPPLRLPLLTGPGPCYYELLLSPEIRRAATLLVQAPVPAPLTYYFYRLKVEELIFLLLAELLKRPPTRHYPLHRTDVQRLYALKAQLLADLRHPPNLTELARTVGMSERKMQRLFKQVFGATIYHYYQQLRLQQAAYLLQAQRVSVAEAGNQVGFTNLSHFARLFAQHFGVTPKKYAKTC